MIGLKAKCPELKLIYVVSEKHKGLYLLYLLQECFYTLIYGWMPTDRSF